MGRKSAKKANRTSKASGKGTGATPEDGRKGPSRVDGRPEAPWGRFPLMEIAVLVGLIMIGIGLFTGSPVLLLGGLLVASVGGLELSLREHFAGYRSHTTLLAFVAGVGSACLCLFGFGLDVRYSFAVGVFVFAILFALLRRAFISASGGLSYRIR
jgi:hypothetical protein